MITSNILKRVFHIKYLDDFATCFTIDIDKKQYIVTAKHVLENAITGQFIEIFYKGDWHRTTFNLVGHAIQDVDISVISINQLITHPSLSIEADAGHLMYGQDVYFLGYPYGMKGDVGEAFPNFPLPFVKKAILSTFIGEKFILDGHNNFGFSGGPVIFKPNGDSSLKNEYKIASIVSGYTAVKEPTYDEKGEISNIIYKYNTGLIVTYNIKYAIDLIKANPIGCHIT